MSDIKWDDTKKLKVIYGIASAMSFLHSNEVIHRDLKPENILIDNLFNIKVTDFGLSKILHKNDESNSLDLSANGFKGTILYSSPEAISDFEYTKSGDVYSFAMIVYEIITNKIPFQNCANTPMQIMNGNRPEIDSLVPDSYKQLIEFSWSQDPSKRPTFDQILEELANNRGFITESVDEDEFFQYVEFINQSKKEFISKVSIQSFKNFIGVKEEYEFITPTKEVIKHDFYSSMEICDVKYILTNLYDEFGKSIFLVFKGKILDDNDLISIVRNDKVQIEPIQITIEKPEQITITLNFKENGRMVQIPLVKGVKGSDIQYNALKITKINFQSTVKNIKSDDLLNEDIEIDAQIDFDSKIFSNKSLNNETEEQLYINLVIYLRDNQCQKIIHQMIDEFKALFPSNQKIAELVLSNQKEFFELSIENKHQFIREEYNDLILAAHSFCSKETKNNFYINILSELSNNPIIFFNNWECFGSFFVLFEQIIPEQINQMVLIIGLIDFILKGIEQYDLSHMDQIYGKINLSKVLDIITKYIHENEEVNNEIIFSQMINSLYFIQLTESPYHEASFYNLLFYLLKYQKNQENFMAFLSENDQSIPLPALSLMLFNILSLDKEKLIDSFFDIIGQRKIKSIIHFFVYFRKIVKLQSYLMIKYSSIWIQKFLISTDTSLRKEIESLIQLLLPENGTEILFNSMINSFPVLDSFLDKISSISLIQTQYPTLEFFNSLQMIISSGGLINKSGCSFFLDRMKKYGNKKYFIPQFHLFNFMISLYGSNLFNYLSLNNFIDALGKNNMPEIILKLPFIVPKKCDAYLKSSFFTDLLRQLFDPNSTNQQDAISIINKLKTEDNINLIAEKLFDKLILQKCIENKNINYMKLCWKLLQEYPQVSKQFYNSEAYLFIWPLVTSQSNEMLPLAKMLAYFNLAFIQQYKNPISLFKNKIEKIYETYENMYSFIPNLLKLEIISTNLHNPGSGGLYHLIRSLIKMSPKAKLAFYNKLKTLNKPLMSYPGPKKPIAMLICELCFSDSTSSDINDILMREFRALEITNNDNSYIAFEYFINNVMKFNQKELNLNEFANIAKEKILNNVLSVKIISKSFINYIISCKNQQIYLNDDLIQIRSQIQKLIQIIIDDMIVPDVSFNIIQESTNFLSNCYECVKILTQFIGDKKPHHSIIVSELNIFINILVSSGMNNEVNELLNYVS